jgi:hypothetical protein
MLLDQQNDTVEQLVEADTKTATRTICTIVQASTHRRLRQLSAALDAPNSEVIDRGLKLLELRVIEEQG